jgi:hypothetical protein
VFPITGGAPKVKEVKFSAYPPYRARVYVRSYTVDKGRNFTFFTLAIRVPAAGITGCHPLDSLG